MKKVFFITGSIFFILKIAEHITRGVVVGIDYLEHQKREDHKKELYGKNIKNKPPKNPIGFAA